MSNDLQELLDFLSSESPQVKLAAVEIVQGLTGNQEGIDILASNKSQLLLPLLQFLGDEKEISHLAAEALVNLSQDSELTNDLIAAGAVLRVMELLGKPNSSINRLLVMLLVNLTRHESGAEALFQVGDAKLSGLHVSRLVRFFTRFEGGNEGEDDFEHVASVLVNITRLAMGRNWILDRNRGLLKQILPHIDSARLVRRQGVAGTVRNCCFEAATELPNLLLASEFLWPALLLPLAGNQPFSLEDTCKMPSELANVLSHEREAEQDPQVRIEAADALYLLAMQEGGRRALWDVNGLRILQVGYEGEQDLKVMEAYERVGSLLVGE